MHAPATLRNYFEGGGQHISHYHPPSILLSYFSTYLKSGYFKRKPKTFQL
jgi:hypothetical protein